MGLADLFANSMGLRPADGRVPRVRIPVFCLSARSDLRESWRLPVWLGSEIQWIKKRHSNKEVIGMPFQIKILRPVIAVGFILSVLGCASFQTPAPAPEDAPFKQRAQTQQEGDIRVTAVVLSAEESKIVFGFPLYDKGIQPIWLEIENKGDLPMFFLPASVDREYFSSLEVAYLHHSMFYSDAANDEIDRLFYDSDIGIFIDPDSIRSGFIFTHLDEGTKMFNVELIADDTTLRALTFFIPVPGIKVDHHEVDFESLYAEDQIISYDEEGLRKALKDLPCCATNEDGTEQGDPLNLVVIGDGDDVYQTFVRAGWDETETIYGASAWKTGVSFIFGGRYRYSPVSALYVFGRGQDVAFQKARGSINERNHLRLWLAPMRYENKPVWTGQISRDIGVRFTLKTITTHKIDPDVDETRIYLAQDLFYSQGVQKFGYVKGVGAALMDAPRQNLTGDPYFTDGHRVVIWLSSHPVALSDVKYVDWETPYLK
jgi:hypothetical protein